MGSLRRAYPKSLLTGQESTDDTSTVIMGLCTYLFLSVLFAARIDVRNAFTAPRTSSLIWQQSYNIRLSAWSEDKNKLEQTQQQQQRRPPNVRMKIFAFLNLPKVEVAAALAVLLSSFLVAVDTLSLPTTIQNLDSHEVLENVLTLLNIIFAVDFFIRWYAAGNFKPIYLTKPLTILDIVCVLVPLVVAIILPCVEYALGSDVVANLATATPSFLQFDSTGLQNLLLLRILRIRRVLTDVKTFGRFQAALGFRGPVRPYQLQLARVLLSIFTLLSVASGLVYTFEKDVNPNIQDYFSALYFGLTTLTTVGFGDIVPVTSEGRIIVCLSILAGVAIIPAQTASLVDAILLFNEERKRGGPRVTITAKDGTKRKTPVSSTVLREASTETEPDQEWVGWLGKCCLECESTDHREDALYCWSCGTKF